MSRHTGRGAAARPQNPLVRRVVATSVTTAAFGLFGLAAPAQAAETLVVEDFFAVESAEPGQQVAVDPSAMDFKVRKAVLLAMPLQFSEADRAAGEFASMSPIMLGTAEEGSNFYSGSSIADAGAERIAELESVPPEEVDSVTTHFKNLTSLGNAITVNAESQEPAPPPPEPEPEPAPEPDPAPEPEPEPEPTPEPAPPPSSAPDGVAPGTTAPPTSGGLPNAPGSGSYPGYGAMSAPGFSFEPGTVPDWKLAEFGRSPGAPPPPPDTAREQQQQGQDEVRAVGRAEAMPMETTQKVALPVLVAAIGLAVVTAGLVRTWVLRRS